MGVIVIQHTDVTFHAARYNCYNTHSVIQVSFFHHLFILKEKQGGRAQTHPNGRISIAKLSP